MDLDLDLNHRPQKPPRSDFGIGAVGAGFIMRDVQLKAWMDLWLYCHVPMSIALLVALTIHIVSVFFYW